MTLKTIPLPTRSTKEIEDYNRALEKGMKSYFVVQNGEGWYVRKASVRKSKGTLHPTKFAAVTHAKELARKAHSEVIVFNKTGQLIDRL